jgi:hypothetical protein
VNTPVTHPLVGTEQVYRPDLPPYDPAADTEPGVLIVAHGMTVQVKTAYRDWNGVKGLDMFYVYVPATGFGTHVTPLDLRVCRLCGEGIHPTAQIAICDNHN